MKTVDILNELKSLFMCIKHNASIVIVPGTIIMLFEITSNEWNGFRLILGFVYLFLFIFTFDLSNQINGLTEDIINKPERPLASGNWNLKQAWRYLIISNLMLTLSGLVLGILPYTLAWIAVASFHNFWGHKNWFLKNHISLTIGAFILLNSALRISNLNEMPSQIEIMIVSLAGGMGSVTQDFKDINGDKLLERRTLPIMFGQKIAIIITAISLTIGYGIFDTYFLFKSTNLLTTEALFLIIILVQILNLFFLFIGKSQQDYKTIYDIFKANFILYVSFLVIV